MRALRRLPHRAMVAASSVGVGVVVAGGRPRRRRKRPPPDRTRSSGQRQPPAASVQFAFRRRSVKYVTVSAGGVATHVVSYHCILAYPSTTFHCLVELNHADDAWDICAITPDISPTEFMIDERVTKSFLIVNVKDIEPIT